MFQSLRLAAAAAPGVDVMTTIFCDFRQISVKKLAFFLKTNVMIKFLHYLASFRVKNAIFLWRKYFQNPNVGPSTVCTVSDHCFFFSRGSFECAELGETFTSKLREPKKKKKSASAVRAATAHSSTFNGSE
jgi:hypothetical protein